MIASRLCAALALTAIAIGCSATDSAEQEVDRTSQAVSCKPKLVYYPVRGKHDNGYRNADTGKSSLWTCNDERSNSDFVAGDHLGNDVWAKEGTPLVATVDGTLTLVANNGYSGKKLTIIDSCGWYHFYAHMQNFGPGIVPGEANGMKIKAGRVVGYVGKTGTSSNGVVHLHYSIYPDGNYDKGVNPHPYLKAVEKDVCNLPEEKKDAPPVGEFESAACEPDGIKGWAADEDDLEAITEVRLSFDKPDPDSSIRVKADKRRPDLEKAFDGHGFSTSLPAELADGNPHEIFAYAADKEGKPVLLANAPRTITCAAPGEEMPPTSGPSELEGPEPTPTTPETTGRAALEAPNAADEGCSMGRRSTGVSASSVFGVLLGIAAVARRKKPRP